LQDAKNQKQDLDAKVAAQPKALEEKTAAVTKAEENLKTITGEKVISCSFHRFSFLILPSGSVVGHSGNIT